jgi:hypothetical protein
MAWTEPTYIAAAQTTGNILQSERKFYVTPRLYWLERDLTPFLHITGGGSPGADGRGLPVRKQAVTDPDFKVIEKYPHGNWSGVNYSTGYATTATTILCDDVTMFSARDVVKDVVSGEVLLVTGKSTGDSTITVVRAFGATSADTISDNDPLLIMGNANEEKAAYGTPSLVQNRYRTNYCQNFREFFGLSTEMKNTSLYQGMKEPEINMEAMIRIKKRIEAQFKFGEPKMSLTAGPDKGNPIRETGGLDYYITNGGGYTMTATTTFTKTMFATFCQNIFQYNSESGNRIKIFLASPLIVSMLSYWKDGNLRFTPKDEVYGLRVAEWETGHGTLIIVRDQMLQASPYGSGGYGGTGFVVDPPNVSYNYLQNCDLQVKLNVVKDGSDGDDHEIQAICGLGIINPETMAKLDAVATYS